VKSNVGQSNFRPMGLVGRNYENRKSTSKFSHKNAIGIKI